MSVSKRKVKLNSELQRARSLTPLEIGRVFICDRKHPHYGESGVFTGKVIQLLGQQMAEVKLDQCKHGTDGCFVNQGQVQQEKRGQ